MIKAQSQKHLSSSNQVGSQQFHPRSAEISAEFCENFNMNALTNCTVRISPRNTVGIQMDSLHLCIRNFQIQKGDALLLRVRAECEWCLSTTRSNLAPLFYPRKQGPFSSRSASPLSARTGKGGRRSHRESCQGQSLEWPGIPPALTAVPCINS